MTGADVAEDYLQYVLQTTANGCLKGQSVALIRNQVRAELFNHFRSAEQRLVADAPRLLMWRFRSRIRGRRRVHPSQNRGPAPVPRTLSKPRVPLSAARPATQRDDYCVVLDALDETGAQWPGRYFPLAA